MRSDTDRRSNASAVLLFAAVCLSLVPAAVCWRSVEFGGGHPTLQSAFIHLQQKFQPPQLIGKWSSVCNLQSRGVHVRGSKMSLSVSQSEANGFAAEAARIRVVSFDLDDTLWPTGDVVHTANAEMQRWLNDKYPGTPTAKDIQDIMRVIRKTRAEADLAAGRPKAPVSYTELRKAGLAQAVMDAGFSEQDASEGSEDGFKKAANELLFDGARETLQQIRNEHPHLIVGAITNGRGDVNLMPKLAGLFDFSVSGEEPGVFPARKPSLDIYREAARRAARVRAAGSEAAEDVVAREAEGWLHVGDDLANDVAPAKALGMRTVWVEQADEGWRASFSTMSPEEDAARKALAQSSSPDYTISSVTSLPEILASLV